MGQWREIPKLIGNKLSASSKNDGNITYSNDFSKSLDKDIESLNNYKTALNGGMTQTDAFTRYLAGASAGAKEYANATNAAEISATAFATKQRSAEIATIAQGRSLTNTRAIINTYNSGTEKLGLTTDEFTESVKTGNNGLGNYLSSLNGAEASMGGYIKSLVGAKISTIGLQIASAALNAALTFGISIALQWLISLVSDLIHREERLIEKSEDARSCIQSITDEFEDNSKTVEDVKKRYAELAQGVENIGKLTQSRGTLNNEEYEEFLDLSNQLSDLFPQLTVGYDSNGNAILNLTGNVNGIVKSLDDLVERQRELANQEILKQLPDLYKGYSISVEKARDTVDVAKRDLQSLLEIQKALNGENVSIQFDRNGRGAVEDINGEEIILSRLEFIEKLKELNIEYSDEMNDDPWDRWTKITVAGIDGSYSLATQLASQIESARKELAYQNGKFQSELSSISQYMITWLQGEWAYNKLNDSGLQQAVQQILMNFDPGDLPNDVDKNDWTAVSEWIRQNILFAISNVNDKEVSEALAKLFSGDDMTFKELEGYIEKIKNFFGEDNPVYLLIKPKVEYADDKRDLVERVKKKVGSEYADKVGDLSIEDLEIAAKLEVPEGVLLSWNELCIKIKQAKQSAKAFEAPKVTTESTINDLNALSKGFEQLDKIYKDVTDGGAFDVSLIADNKDFKESFSSLKSYTDFLGTIVKYPDDIKKCQDAFNQLTYEYIQQSGVLDILNDNNKDLVANYLKAMGVENAAALVDEQYSLNKKQLVIEKEKERIETELGVEATADEIAAKMQETKAVGLTKVAYAQLAIQKMLIDSNSIKTTSDVESLENLANSANATAASLEKIVRAKQLIAEAEELEKKKALINVPNKNGIAYLKYDKDDLKYAAGLKTQLDRAKWVKDLNGLDDLNEAVSSKLKSAQEILSSGLEYNRVDFSEFMYAGGDKSAQTGESAAEKAAREAKEAFTNEYNAHKHKVQMELETEKAYYDWLEKRSKEVYDSKIIDEGDYWKYQEEVFSGRRNLFKDYLSDVEHYISMLSNRGGQEDKILTLYKKLIAETKEKLQEAYMSGLGVDNSYVQELQNKLQTYTNNIISTLDDVVKKANEVVDGFQNVYTTLTDVAKEYTANGYLSVDSLQKILDLSPKYLEMLADENGQLVVNEQALQKIIAAKTEEMGAETALAYAKKVLFATEQNEISTLETLANVNAAASHATWDMAYATVGLARAIGTANGIDTSYYDNAVSYITKMRSLTKTAVNSVSAYYETLSKEASDSYGSQKDALETILKLTEDMIQKENEDLIQSLEDQKDKYAEIIEKKKELINLAKEEDDHNASINEKLQKASKLQAQIAALSLDDSRSAAAEKKSLEEELTSLQKEIADEQNNYYVDAQLDALDDELDAFNDAKDKEIENQRNMLSSTEKLYRAAIDRIENNWDTLYQDLLSWNYEYGSTLQDDLISAWDAASDAVKRYGSFVAAVNGGGAGTAHIGDGSAENIVGSMRDNSERWLTASASERKRLEADNLAKAEDYRRATGDNIRLGNDGVWYHENGEKLYSLSKDDKARSIVARMKNNSKLWSSADESEREALVAENERLAQTLEGVLGKRITKDMNGTWWIDGKKLYSVYHKGGIAGDAPSLKQNEVMAVLEKGEAVLDANREKGLYKIVDFVSVLSDKLGKTLDEANINRVFNMTPKLDVHSILSNGIKGAVADIAAAGIDRNYTIEHIDVTAPVSVVQKLDTEEIKRHARTIGSVSAEYIKEGFSKRGINSKTSKF